MACQFALLSPCRPIAPVAPSGVFRLHARSFPCLARVLYIALAPPTSFSTSSSTAAVQVAFHFTSPDYRGHRRLLRLLVGLSLQSYTTISRWSCVTVAKMKRLLRYDLFSTIVKLQCSPYDTNRGPASTVQRARSAGCFCGVAWEWGTTFSSSLAMQPGDIHFAAVVATVPAASDGTTKKVTHSSRMLTLLLLLHERTLIQKFRLTCHSPVTEQSTHTHRAATQYANHKGKMNC